MNSQVHPTLLALPDQQWKIDTQAVLPLPPEAYAVTPGPDWWFVTVRETGSLIYAGPGPVQVRVSPAPF